MTHTAPSQIKPLKVTTFAGQPLKQAQAAKFSMRILSIRFGDYILRHPVGSCLHVDISLPVYRNSTTGVIVAQVRESISSYSLCGEPDHILVIYPQPNGENIKRYIKNMSIADACAQFIFI